MGAAAAARAPRRATARSSSPSRTSTGPSRRCWSCSTTSSRCRAASPILLVCLTRPELLEARPAWAAPQPNRSRARARRARRRAGARARRAPRRAASRAARIARARRGQPAVRRAARRRRRGPGRRASCRRASRPCSPRASTASSRPSARCCSAPRSRGARFTPARWRRCCPTASARGVARAARRARAQGADRRRPPGVRRRGRVSLHPRADPRGGLRGRCRSVVRAELHAGVAEWLEQRPARGRRDRRLPPRAGVPCWPPSSAARASASARSPRARSQRLRGGVARGARRAATRRRRARCSSARSRSPAPTSAARGALLPALGASLFEAGRMTDADARARRGDRARRPTRALQARAQVEREFVRLETEHERRHRARRARVADAALPVLERDGDDHGPVPRLVAARAGRVDRGPRRRAPTTPGARPPSARGAPATSASCFDVLGWRATAAVLGPTPVDEAIAPLRGVPRRSSRASPVAVAWTLNPLASLHAMQRRVRARRAAACARPTRRSRELGSLRLERLAPRGARAAARRAARARRGAAARRRRDARVDERRQRCSRRRPRCSRRPSTPRGASTRPASCAARRPRGAARRRHRHAGHLARRAGEGPRRARAAATRREALAREAVALVEPTDLLSHHGDAMLDLAEVLRTCCSARTSAAAPSRPALALYERKGNVAAAARARCAARRADGSAFTPRGMPALCTAWMVGSPHARRSERRHGLQRSSTRHRPSGTRGDLVANGDVASRRQPATADPRRDRAAADGRRALRRCRRRVRTPSRGSRRSADVRRRRRSSRREAVIVVGAAQLRREAPFVGPASCTIAPRSTLTAAVARRRRLTAR